MHFLAEKRFLSVRFHSCFLIELSLVVFIVFCAESVWTLSREQRYDDTYAQHQALGLSRSIKSYSNKKREQDVYTVCVYVYVCVL